MAIGSYPRTSEERAYGVKISVTSRDEDALKAAEAAIRGEIDILPEEQAA